MDDEEAEAGTRLLFRSDLEVAATASADKDATFVIDAAMRVLDRGSVFEPTLLFTTHEGVQIIDPPNECTMVGTELKCVLSVYFDQAVTGSDRNFPTDWLPLALTATVNANAPEPHQISITAVSRENGLDNDPDPTNNTITLDLSP